MRSAFFVAPALIVLLSGCSQPSAPAPGDVEAIAHEAHENYVTAINSNNLDTLLADLTDDVVYLAPHEKAVVGKTAVAAWLKAYLGAYTIDWDKTTDEFFVSDDWAIERYSYREPDIPKAGGVALDDTGKGINIYRRGGDGKWRVARDAWNSDLPPPAPAPAPASSAN